MHICIFLPSGNNRKQHHEAVFLIHFLTIPNINFWHENFFEGQNADKSEDFIAFKKMKDSMKDCIVGSIQENVFVPAQVRVYIFVHVHILIIVIEQSWQGYSITTIHAQSG